MAYDVLEDFVGILGALYGALIRPFRAPNGSSRAFYIIRPKVGRKEGRKERRKVGRGEGWAL